ncbi:hypothetical protein JXQ31_03215 [candidate division KSB1 bacterium]|nr:hypothetical protein [candidate division KSB1 bacterium]
MSIIIHIFDVEHGACNIIETSNNKLIMIDCGKNLSTGWRPSNWIRNNNLEITNLTIANIDEDHVSDLVKIIDNCEPLTLKTNWNLKPDWIEKRKKVTGRIGQGVEKLIEIMRNKYTGNSIFVDYGLTKRRFCHSFNDFDDFNNLSLVSFYSYSNIGILFPGNLEKAGWKKHLTNNEFCNCLKKTNFLLASHHGRESGFCEEIFDFCKPELIIISDEAIEHETQLSNLYSKYASGIMFGDTLRKVLTTRKDGKIKIEINTDSSYTVYLS